MKVTNAQELTQRIAELRKAQKQFAEFTQEQVDKIMKLKNYHFHFFYYQMSYHQEVLQELLQ